MAFIIVTFITAILATVIGVIVYEVTMRNKHKAHRDRWERLHAEYDIPVGYDNAEL